MLLLSSPRGSAKKSGTDTTEVLVHFIGPAKNSQTNYPYASRENS